MHPLVNLTKGSCEWWTPPELIHDLGPFDLDPCAGEPVPWETATEMYSEGGLLRQWHGRVWLNPPYGNEIGRWLSKLKHHGNGIALVFARTGAPWFHEHIWNSCDGILFLRKRLYFHHKDGKKAKQNAGADLCLVAYGGSNRQALQTCDIEGKFIWIRPVETQSDPQQEINYAI